MYVHTFWQEALSKNREDAIGRGEGGLLHKNLPDKGGKFWSNFFQNSNVCLSLPHQKKIPIFPPVEKYCVKGMCDIYNSYRVRVDCMSTLNFNPFLHW